VCGHAPRNMRRNRPGDIVSAVGRLIQRCLAEVGIPG